MSAWKCQQCGTDLDADNPADLCRPHRAEQDVIAEAVNWRKGQYSGKPYDFTKVARAVDALLLLRGEIDADFAAILHKRNEFIKRYNISESMLEELSKVGKFHQS